MLRAQENERRSLARELYDEVGQSLSAILMEAENAVCAGDRRETADHLQSNRTLAERTVNEVRDLALLLRPSMLDDFGLMPALNWHARETARRTGLRIAVSAGDDANDLPDEHKTRIHRLVQEAVNNAAHHANAGSVEVTLERESRRVLATVRDDGAGFDTRFVRGMGLLGMEERVRRLGGRFQIDSQLGCRTVVSAELPVVELADPMDGMPIAYCWLATTRWCAMACARCSRNRPTWPSWPKLPMVATAPAWPRSNHPMSSVMDIGRPSLNGIEATRGILAANPRAAVVMLSMHQDESYVLRRLKAGT